MIGLGLALSRSMVMFRPAETWPDLYGQPYPELEDETLAVRQTYEARFLKALGTMRARLEAYSPDAILLIADDRDEIFASSHRPTFAVVNAPEFWGYCEITRGREPDESARFQLTGHQELASFLLEGLVEQGFDMAWTDRFEPMGNPAHGLGHGYTTPILELLPRLDVPVIVVTMNLRFEAVPSTRRMYKFGQAVGNVLSQRPERIAAITTGGLSIRTMDEALDQWFLAHLASGNIEPLLNLFTFPSKFLDAGTTELKNWVTMAGVCGGAPAKVLDYISCYHGVAGCALAIFER